MSDPSIAARACEALDMALDQPHAARALAFEALTAARAAGLEREEAVALRALGLAARALHEIASAAEILTEAVDAAARAGDGDLEAECRVSLAGAQIFAGEGERALATLAAASAGPRVAVSLASTRAGILSLLGRYEEALTYYDPVVKELRRSGERLLETRALNNRGLAHMFMGRFHLAEIDMARAERLATELGQLTEATRLCHNRGLVAARRGDLPTALALFDRAEARYSEAGVALGSRAMDQAEALLAAGLVRDARELVRRAIGAMRAGGELYALPQALLLLADCAHLAGDVEAARAAALEAIELFAEQDRPGWAALARAAYGRVVLASGTGSVEAARAASEAACELDRLGFAARAVGAHAVAGKLWMATTRGPDDLGRSLAQAELAHAAAARRRGQAADRAVAWDAEAARRLAAGDRRGALTALKAALATVDAQQAGLSATELRAHVSLHAEVSATLGLRLAIEAGRPRQILAWMERRRANSLRSWPVRPPPDPELARDLAELRRVAGAMVAAASSGTDPRPLARQQARLERAVRERAWQLAAVGSSTRESLEPTAEQLGEALGEWALVELADCGGELHGVILAGGRCSHRSLGPSRAVLGELEHLRFALRRSAYGMRSGTGANVSSGESAARLDDLLLGPIRTRLGDRPVMIVPTGALHAVPWSALPTISGRPVTVAPSAHAWLRATRAPSSAGPLLAVAGPGLPAARAEVKALRTIHPGAEILSGRRATAAAVLKRLQGAAVAHVAAHATLNADNGLWSALQLADGPLTVYELEGLTRAPGLVVLSACQSGLSAVRPGDEVLGLVAALLALGAKTVIASVLPVDDYATAELMVALHVRLASGQAPAAALAGARTESDDAVIAASFVCFGAG